MRSTIFDNNVANAALSLYWSSAQDSLLTNCTFRNHAPGTPIIQATNALHWECPSGQYMPLTGTFPNDFSGCHFKCSPGTVGVLPNLTSAAECDPCPLGHYCDAPGLGEGIPCPRGTRMPAIGARSLDSCLPCGAGRFQNLAGQTECSPCLAGSFTEEDKANACTACPNGGFCPDAGASSRLVFQPCPAGTYNEVTGATSNASCVACAPGKANPVPGSTSASACRACLPGGWASKNGMAVCDLCPEGKFTSSSGSTECEPCTPGYSCVKGASAPLPCAGGTYSTATNLKSAAECTAADPGFFATTGSTSQTPCRKGSYTDATIGVKAECRVPTEVASKSTAAQSRSPAARSTPTPLG